eukprot:CAMPEP_0201492448 /NCGR_PEP_ID=MMETSP0151_2-20130828/33137_1 /ASSEMBLY_ACC=CAM_ASM_000257 /TAXON_ID=200890 /ORGANISM="Paramoeba atlantica, Strain 621/1 / CCAP 1560/9" /LENGTH=132 /DNA_ID=CAMNT_0047879255 /DNA_START=52 /DNA_END=450 /DNA_ORIENTATION=+
MRKEECTFSGLPVHPGHGIRFVATNFVSTKPVLPFASNRCTTLYRRKKNARYVPWTRMYRRINRKGMTEETARRRARKSKKVVQRGFVGADVETLRTMKQAVPKKPERGAAAAAIRAEIKARKEMKGGKGKK